MRDVRSGAGDVRIAGEAGDFGRVGRTRPAQPQPLGLQPEDIISQEIGKHRCRTLVRAGGTLARK